MMATMRPIANLLRWNSKFKSEIAVETWDTWPLEGSHRRLVVDSRFATNQELCTFGVRANVPTEPFLVLGMSTAPGFWTPGQ